MPGMERGGKGPEYQEGPAPVQMTGEAWVKQGQFGHGEGPGR